MKKNCSSCKEFHEPPFRRYCKFTDIVIREDPKYLQYLEESFLETLEASGGSGDKTDLDVIVRRLEAFEVQPRLTTEPSPLGHGMP